MSCHTLDSRLPLSQMAKAIRFLTVDAVEKAKSGHAGMPLGMADVATVLFTHFLKFDPMDPKWPDRDRFILSAGHGSMLLYSLLYLTGYQGMTLEDLKQFRQLHSKTPGHPEYGETPGVETSTGPLGQGLGNAVGMALAESLLRARFRADLVDHHTYVIAGDGCLMEGISHEVISLAGHLCLNKLIVLFDDNRITIDGSTALSTSENHCTRFEAAGWNVIEIDGHNYEEIFNALHQAQGSGKPTLIAARTVIGQGAPTKAGTSRIHGAPLGVEEIALMRTQLNWPFPAFEVPQDILEAWRHVGRQKQQAHYAWQQRLKETPLEIHKSFLKSLSREMGEEFKQALNTFKEACAKDPKTLATRKSSEEVLNVTAPLLPMIVGGSADLTESNNTFAKSMVPVTPGNFQGNYIHYGIREHGMGAIMNGLSLHGGCLPYGGTFLAFSDYMRPAIRLAALMNQQVIYVLTHDSIGLGEDGPTHQPIEHLMSLRLIPNLLVFRPADTIETAECWELALEHKTSPSVLALTRQSLPSIRQNTSENLCAQGGYILSPALKTWDISLIASGSEVSLALEVQKLLKLRALGTAVISMPCMDLFEKHSQAEKDTILGPAHAIRIVIEAGASKGWQDIGIKEKDLVIGINRFGISAPYHETMDYFGFTASKITTRILDHLTAIGAKS